MKRILSLLFLIATVARGAQLHTVPVSNAVNVPHFLGVATDGLNVVRVAAADYALQAPLDATNAHFQTAIANAISYGISKTNPVAIADSAFAGYVGLKLLQRSNDWNRLGFFDYTGAEAFQFRAGLTNGIFDFFDVQNDRTVFRYNGTNKTTTFFNPVAFSYVSTPGTIAAFDGDRGLTNTTATAGDLNALPSVNAILTNGVLYGHVFGNGFNHGTWLGSNVYNLIGWRQVGSGTPWSATGTFGTNHNIRFYPFQSGNGGSFDSINFNVKAAGSIDFGIYESRSYTNLEPYNLIASTGSNVWASTGDQTFSTNFVLKPGRIYWMAAGHVISLNIQLGAPSTLTGLNSDAPLALNLAAFSTTQVHTWEMVNCFTNNLPTNFPSGFQIIGQTASGMAFPIALKGN